MATDPYRGGEAARAARIAALDQEIARLEATLTAVFWERVAPVWKVPPPGSRLEGDALEARERRASLLREAIRRAEIAPDAAADLDPAPDRRRGGAFDSALDDPDVVRAFERLAAASPGAEVLRRGPHRWGIRLRAEDVPVDASVFRLHTRNASYWQWSFTTTAAPSALLRLRPEGILQDVLEMFGLGREIELGDRRFDPTFVITGDEPSAKAILTTDVRADLLALSARGRTVLTVARGAARLEVLNPLGPAGVLVALRILRAIHHTPSPCALVSAPPAEP